MHCRLQQYYYYENKRAASSDAHARAVAWVRMPSKAGRRLRQLRRCVGSLCGSACRNNKHGGYARYREGGTGNDGDDARPVLGSFRSAASR